MIQGLTFHDRYYHRTHFKNTPELYYTNEIRKRSTAVKSVRTSIY